MENGYWNEMRIVLENLSLENEGKTKIEKKIQFSVLVFHWKTDLLFFRK